MPITQEMASFVEKSAGLIERTRSIGKEEAETKAALFLTVSHRLSVWIHELSYEKVMIGSLERMEYARAMGTDSKRPVTEKKAFADADQIYQLQREKQEKLEADIAFLKDHQKIFSDAHIFYRQTLRDES